jgi:hypothetical protein
VKDNSFTVAEVQDRRRHDAEMFRKAGLDKPKRTYKFDPTKPRL